MTSEIKVKVKTLEKQIENGSNLESSAALLMELKIALATLPGMAPIAICRDVYELATLLSVRQEDEVSFERHVAQVKTYYVDYAEVMEQSSRQNLILGLNLLRLMAQNRIAEFHTELELIPSASRSDKYISYPLRLENYLMEGSYSKMREEKIAVPDASFNFFVDMLMVTVREEIAACCERAYKKLECGAAQRMLSIGTEEELVGFCKQKGWKVEDGKIAFKDQDEGGAGMDQVRSEDFITRSLQYARELEQII